MHLAQVGSGHLSSVYDRAQPSLLIELSPSLSVDFHVEGTANQTDEIKAEVQSFERL